MSTETSSGGYWAIPGGWHGDGPASLGWVWMGVNPYTQEDVEELIAVLNSTGWAATDDPAIDPFTRNGRYHPRWTTYLDLMEGTQGRPGHGG